MSTQVTICYINDEGQVVIKQCPANETAEAFIYNTK